MEIGRRNTSGSDFLCVFFFRHDFFLTMRYTDGRINKEKNRLKNTERYFSYF